MDFNSCNLMGRLTKDAEISVTKNGTSIAKFSIANNGMKDSVNYFDIYLTQNVDKIGQYLTKGRAVIMNCSAKQDRWEGKDGITHSRVVFYTQGVNFISSGAQRSENPADEYVTKAAAEAKKTKEAPLPTTHFDENIQLGLSPDDPTPEKFDDDIPF